MKSMKTITSLAAVVILAAGLAACKHSGVAVSKGGQIIAIDIDAPSTLGEGIESKALNIKIANNGVNKLSSLSFDVIMPTELIVVSQTQSPGVTWTERVTAGGEKLYHYTVNEIGVGSRARVNYHVRTAFGTRDRTGDIKVTAYSDQLPGDRLIETKSISLNPS